ncbi:MAG: PQQ-dependent sugar dehydrogenase [Planctomycetota bacterium]|nr:PQQ-dependent sugar dehydrogenase [Planctomycetota bacterium]
MKSTAALVSAFAATLFVASATPADAQTPLTTVRVASGLSSPLFVTSPEGDPRLFIVEQHGRIKILTDGAVLATPFLDIDAKVLGSGERGLLGLAFHPDYSTNGFFYVSYSDNAGDTILERYSVSANPDLADDTSGVHILFVDQPFSNHNGGGIHFGPDGMLYLALGDGGSGGDPGCRSQKGDTLLGKLLRLDIDGGLPYAIPPDNPYVGDPRNLDEIWARGLRNPWRWSFDRETGDLWIGDVGQGAKEEISFTAASSTGGENYGWKIMEGFNCFSTAACPPTVPSCGDSSLTLPVHDYTHASGCSVTGGYVYRGSQIPDLQGTYFFADYCSARIWSFEFDGVSMSNFQERTSELAPGGGLTINLPASFGEDADGNLYICDLGGEVFQIVPDIQASATVFGCGVNPAGSIQITGGAPVVGGSFTVGIDNPLGTQSPGALSFLAISLSPDPNYPCGTLQPGWGMAGPGADGEILIATTGSDPFVVLSGPVWGGTGNPVSFTINIPPNYSLVGEQGYIQGLLRDPSSAVTIGLTEAVEVQFGL